MIGYRISRARLKWLIEAASPGWIADSAGRTAGFRKRRRYDEERSTWSKVKPVYMELQGESKCGYCERKLESVKRGKVEQDVEHFRPKKEVRAWRLPATLKGLNVPLSQPPGKKGYYLLAYDPFNYLASCGPCNRVLKKNSFPIAGNYEFTGSDPRRLLREKPYLIYPLGDFDDDPEALIEFYGTSPRAASRSGRKRLRAIVTIEFFELDDPLGRKNLITERARIIIAMFPQLEAAQRRTSKARSTAAKNVIKGYTQAVAPHASCARSFRRLFRARPKEAEQIFLLASQLIGTVS